MISEENLLFFYETEKLYYVGSQSSFHKFNADLRFKYYYTVDVFVSILNNYLFIFYSE